MGLDITAYSRLEPLGQHSGDWCEEQYEPETYERLHIQAFAYDCFPASFRGIPALGKRESGGSTFLDGGCWDITPATRTHAFRAGSYGGYNAWRADLQRQFNPTTDPAGPFYELIWFADNEGCIGPGAAKDLLEDFRKHFERYMPPDRDDWWLAKYKDWLIAFELAADGGLVHFH